MLDYTSVAEGVMAGVTSHHLTQVNSEEDIHLVMLRDVRDTLSLLHEFLVNNSRPSELDDTYKSITISKAAFGPAILLQLHERQYVRVLASASTVLNVQTVIGAFSITIPAATWTPLDLPEGSTIALDATFANNTTQLWVRLTNIHP